MVSGRVGGQRPPLRKSAVGIGVGAAYGRPPLPFGTCWRAEVVAPHEIGLCRIGASGGWYPPLRKNAVGIGVVAACGRPP